MNIISPKEAHDLAREKGWYDFERPIPELLCLIHSEISEALEAYRHNLVKGDKGWLGEELADAVIRIWDMAEYLKIDIAEEVNKKHEINKNRPYRHGNKTC
jgi:NTP pyrophosphatase (non-canonical NTP hydrolase)